MLTSLSAPWITTTTLISFDSRRQPLRGRHFRRIAHPPELRWLTQHHRRTSSGLHTTTACCRPCTTGSASLSPVKCPVTEQEGIV
ncbi:hypothetical protein Hanom_Chr12g01137081 [Helianthus anomalus]